MKEYTAREMKLLKANPYTFKVTKNKLYFPIEFKEAFWTAYQAGIAAVRLLGEVSRENMEKGKIIEKVREYWDITSRNITHNAGRMAMKRYLSNRSAALLLAEK